VLSSIGLVLEHGQGDAQLARGRRPGVQVAPLRQVAAEQHLAAALAGLLDRQSPERTKGAHQAMGLRPLPGNELLRDTLVRAGVEPPDRPA
jgi:hypothetical protein